MRAGPRWQRLPGAAWDAWLAVTRVICVALGAGLLWPGAAGLYGGGGPHYGTGVGVSAAAAAAGGVHGFPAVLTSFVGRAGPVREVAGLLEEHRLVTVTGPGGVGKTRLAGQVARAVAGRFADGAWLAELAPVRDPAQVPAVVAAALGVREQPGVPAARGAGAGAGPAAAAAGAG